MLGRINQVLYKLIVRRFEEFRVIHVIFGPSAAFHPGIQVCRVFVRVVLSTSKAQRLYDQKGISKDADVALRKNAQILLPLGPDELECLRPV